MPTNSKIRKCQECKWYSEGLCRLFSFWASRYCGEKRIQRVNPDDTALPMSDGTLRMVKCNQFDFDGVSEEQVEELERELEMPETVNER